MKWHTLARTSLLTGLLFLPAFAQDHFIVRASGASIWGVASRHGLTVVRSFDGSGRDVHVVASPWGSDSNRILQGLKFDSAVQQVEHDDAVALPETSPGPPLRQPGPDALASVADRTLIGYYGTSAWTAYINQPAATIIKVAEAHKYATGGGTVAFLDTGVDFAHPVIAHSLVSGYDFTRGIPGGSEMADVDQSTTAILDQSTTSILDKRSIMVLNQSTTAILDQSTTAILDRHRPPSAFGHGTMVAGLIHLVAPTARLMPVKVFQGDGTSSFSQIISGIYWAIDHGADVINMSFSSTQSSQELMRAINIANSQGVICVASVGNDGKQIMVYPAGYHQVIGVASTNNRDVRSAFSNYGDGVVTVAAPGEGNITLYPGKNYAEVWGTSFSAPLVAGGAALLVQLNYRINESQAEHALSQAVPIGQGLGAGRLDLLQAVRFQGFTHGDH